VSAADLVPGAGPDDPAAVPKEQARQLFDALLKLAERQIFALFNPFLALLVESAGKRV
jgi:hypothetical protein